MGDTKGSGRGKEGSVKKMDLAFHEPNNFQSFSLSEILFQDSIMLITGFSPDFGSILLM